MTDITFTVVYHSDQPEPTQADVDRAARFMAMTLYRSAGPRHDIYYEGRCLNFDASDSGRWTNTVGAMWVEPPPTLCGFTWFDDDGVKQECLLTEGHPWNEGQQELPHSAKGITREQAQRLLREGISSEDYIQLARQIDPELSVEIRDGFTPFLPEALAAESGPPPKAKKAAKKKPAGKRATKKVSGKAK